jgi:phage gpG-like protein
MAGARAAVREEAGRSALGLAEHGVAVAQGLVRVRTGRLRDSIAAEAQFGGDVAIASWAPGTEYAAIHELGGVVRPRRGRYLRFTGRDGKPVFVREVVITPRPYMGPSAEAVRGRLGPALAELGRRVVERLRR